MIPLSKHSKDTLLNIAEWTIIEYLEHGKPGSIPEKFKIDSELCIKTGVFVTVYINEELRGCIGTFSESTELYKNVHQLSMQAAFEDNRFKPVSLPEIKYLSIEISVLSKRQRIYSPDEIILGKHGIYLIHGNKRATLLPQVALENKYSKIEFLECCAKNKLGLSKNSWKDAEIYVYETMIIR